MLSPILLSLKIATIATVFSFVLGVFFAYIINKKNHYRGKISGKPFLYYR